MKKIDRINKQFFLDCLSDIKEYLELEMSASQKVSIPSPLFRFGIFLYNILKRTLKKLGYQINVYESNNFSEDVYTFTIGEKKTSIDFLRYVFENINSLDFNMGFFNTQDQKEIIKFVRNRIYSALLTCVPNNLLFDKEDLDYKKRYRRMYKKIHKKKNYYILKFNGHDYRLPINEFIIDVFYHKKGILELPELAKKQIVGKDIIDAGAYIGDSALVLNELRPRKIYAFEPLKRNVVLIRKTISLNNLKNVEIVDKGLGDHLENSLIVPMGGSSFVHNKGSEKISITTIDNFVKENSLKVGLIKMDIEGMESDAINGAMNTLKYQKPVLIIALYHNGKDFFEIPKK